MSETYAYGARGKPRHQVDRLVLKTMAMHAANSAGRAAVAKALKSRHGDRSTRVALNFIDPDNPFCNEFGTHFRQRGAKVARPLSLQSLDFASRTRRGISASLGSPAA